jgi:hypothetical protein
MKQDPSRSFRTSFRLGIREKNSEENSLDRVFVREQFQIKVCGNFSRSIQNLGKAQGKLREAVCFALFRALLTTKSKADSSSLHSSE